MGSAIFTGALLRLLPGRRGSSLRRGRGEVSVEPLEVRAMLMGIQYVYNYFGEHELEVTGRAADGTWQSTGVDLNPQDDKYFDENTETFATWSAAVDWRHVRFGDFDGDGLKDIAGWDPSSGNWWTSLSDGNGATTIRSGRWTNATTWSDVAVADLSFAGQSNGFLAGRQDLVGRMANGQWWAAVSNEDGTFTNKLLTTWDASAGWRDVQYLDADADGDVDILGRTSTGQWWAAMNQGSGVFQNVFLASWSEGAGWRDVRAVKNFFGDGKWGVFGRAASGDWWVMRFGTGGGGPTNGITIAQWGNWRESAGWRDVLVTGNTIVGRTAGGAWWQLNAVTNTAQHSRLLGSWDESAGWHDVQAFACEEGNFYTGVIGRNDAGVWQAGVYYNDNAAFANLQIATWSTATTWKDSRVGEVTRSPVVYRQFYVSSLGTHYTNTLLIYGHRSGTTVRVTNADNMDTTIDVAYTRTDTGQTQTFTYQVPIISNPGHDSSNNDFRFYGHIAVDDYHDQTFRSGYDEQTSFYVSNKGSAYGFGGDDVLNGINGTHDELFGGEGVDTLLGDPGDQLTQ